LQKEVISVVKASVIWWILCCLTGIIGGLSAGLGIWMEVRAPASNPSGLYMLILSPFLLMFAGVCATVGAKLEAEGK